MDVVLLYTIQANKVMFLSHILACDQYRDAKWSSRLVRTKNFTYLGSWFLPWL